MSLFAGFWRMKGWNAMHRWFQKPSQTNSRMKTKLKLHLLLLALVSLAGFARAQGTAFSYQGRLDDGGLPATGLYDFTFHMFNVDAAGIALAGPLPLNAVPVTNGLFNVVLDFGPGIFTGPARWLEITVRTNGVGVPDVLAPRTPLLPTPYSSFAGQAAGVVNGSVTANQLNVGAPPTAGQFLSYDGGNFLWSDPGVAVGNIWSLNGSSAYYNAGNVGIGIANPQERLTIAGVTSFNSGLKVTGNASGGTGIAIENTSSGGHKYDLLSGGAGTGVGVGGFGIWDETAGSYRLAIDSGGNIGIGTAVPTAGYRLEVVGATILRPGNGTIQYGSPNGEIGMSITPTAGNRADLRFNGSTLKLVASYGVGPPPAEFGISISTNGYVGIGKASPSFKLDVLSDTTTAIVGRSTVASGIGVYGESSQYNGVRGLAHNANHGAVVGVHDGGGIAVYGTGATGVQGDSSSVGGYGGYFRNTAGGIALGVQGTARVGVLQITGGADLAEPFKMSHEHIVKGSVVVIDEEHPGQLKLSGKSYDQRVAGIVSGANGVNPGISLQQEGVLEGGQNVSLSGRVYVQADTANGSIKPGDLLTTSDTPGHAMKVTDHGRAQGAVLGKAMSGLKDGRGMVLVLVTLQ